MGNFVTESGEPLLPLTEILLSGGDPLTLPNATLARYLVLMAESGIRTVRLGSKEMAFNPSRFDDALFSTFDLFHQNYPDVRIELVGHYVHPYELVQPKIDAKGHYLYDVSEQYTVHPELEVALAKLNSRRSWMGHFNQFPIIAGVNDEPAIMRLLLHLTNKLGINMHNVYACREVIGNPHFRGDLTIDRQYDLLEKAKIGLSGLENHARLIMSTEQGKMDVMGHKDGKIFLRLNRFLHGRKPENTMVVVDSSKIAEAGGKFYWLTQEVIDTAIDPQARKMLNVDYDLDTAFIKDVKAAAAAEVRDQVTASAAAAAKITGSVQVEHTAATTREATVEVESRDGDIIQMLHHIPQDGESLADILEANGHVEMVCGGKLSCTTCVGKVTSDQPLAHPSLDEIDATDTVENPDGANLRACCQIKVNPGQSYKFVALQ
jgi:ferredoxin